MFREDASPDGKRSAEHCRMVRSDKRRTEERTQAYERKTEKKEVPAVAVPEAEERNHPTVKVEMKGKEKEEAKGKNMEKPPQKRPEMDSLVVTKAMVHANSRQ